MSNKIQNLKFLNSGKIVLVIKDDIKNHNFLKVISDKIIKFKNLIKIKI